MPKVCALAFIKPTKCSKPPGKVRPKAWAARFSLDIKARCNNSPRGKVTPTRKRELLPFSVSTSSWLMVMGSLMSNLASLKMKPVMSLVSEAMGSTAWSFLLSNTSWVSWSITSAALERRASGSGVLFKPAIWPKLGLAGITLPTALEMGRCARALRALAGWAVGFV